MAFGKGEIGNRDTEIAIAGIIVIDGGSKRGLMFGQPLATESVPYFVETYLIGST